jgi:hypothetical protein
MKWISNCKLKERGKSKKSISQWLLQVAGDVHGDIALLFDTITRKISSEFARGVSQGAQTSPNLEEDHEPNAQDVDRGCTDTLSTAGTIASTSHDSASLNSRSLVIPRTLSSTEDAIDDSPSLSDRPAAKVCGLQIGLGATLPVSIQLFQHSSHQLEAEETELDYGFFIFNVRDFQ